MANSIVALPMHAFKCGERTNRKTRNYFHDDSDWNEFIFRIFSQPILRVFTVAEQTIKRFLVVTILFSSFLRFYFFFLFFYFFCGFVSLCFFCFCCSPNVYLILIVSRTIDNCLRFWSEHTKDSTFREKNNKQFVKIMKRRSLRRWKVFAERNDKTTNEETGSFSN